ncbi:MAG TPA: hypothetical protein VFJ24_00925 [Gaiellales bacterium]|nr:hypothetical protein [Gaiellales bacterium]
MNEQPEHATADPDPPETPYEAPKIERVITQAEMEREVMFAGPGVTTGDL